MLFIPVRRHAVEINANATNFSFILQLAKTLKSYGKRQRELKTNVFPGMKNHESMHGKYYYKLTIKLINGNTGNTHPYLIGFGITID